MFPADFKFFIQLAIEDKNAECDALKVELNKLRLELKSYDNVYRNVLRGDEEFRAQKNAHFVRRLIVADIRKIENKLDHVIYAYCLHTIQALSKK